MPPDDDTSRSPDDVAERAAAEIVQRAEAEAAHHREAARRRFDAILNENREAMSGFTEAAAQHVGAVRESTLNLSRQLTDTIERARHVQEGSASPHRDRAIEPAGPGPSRPRLEQDAGPIEAATVPAFEPPQREVEAAEIEAAEVEPADLGAEPPDPDADSHDLEVEAPAAEPSGAGEPTPPAALTEDRQPLIEASSEVRALAAQMATAGSDRGAIEARLRERFRTANPRGVADDAVRRYG